MTVEQFFVTYYTQTALSGIVAIAAFLKYKTRPMQVKLIGFSFLLSFLCNALAFALWHSPYVRYTNLPQNVFFVINFCILTGLYYSVLTSDYWKWLFIALAICIPFSIYDLFILQKDFIHSYAPFAESFFIITFTLIFFYRLMVELPAVHLHRMPMFWFNSALLFFHSGTLFLFAFTSYLITVLNNDLLAYWSFHNSVSIMEHIIILVGLFFDFKSAESKSSITSPR